MLLIFVNLEAGETFYERCLFLFVELGEIKMTRGLDAS